MDNTTSDAPKNEYRKITLPDGTIRHLKKIDEGKWQLHNAEGAALIPQGNLKKAEYYINGIKYTKDQFHEVKKNSSGLPWYKSGGGRF